MGLAEKIATSIIGLAILSVIVGKNAKTSDVVSSVSTGFANIIKAATAPAT